MISKNKIGEIRQLHQKKFRDQEHLFLVEGRKSVEVLLHSHFTVTDLFATERAFQDNQSLLKNKNIILVSEVEMSRLSTMTTPPELLAIAKQSSASLQLKDNEPIIILDRISDPGNLGTIIRTADWFNFHQIVCSSDCVEFYSPKVIQATMGSFCNVSVRYTDLVSFLTTQVDKRRILGTFMQGSSVTDFTFQPNDIIIIGSESHGICSAVAELVTEKITIPKPNPEHTLAESLNVANAAAIVLYESSKRSGAGIYHF